MERQREQRHQLGHYINWLCPCPSLSVDINPNLDLYNWATILPCPTKRRALLNFINKKVTFNKERKIEFHHSFPRVRTSTFIKFLTPEPINSTIISTWIYDLIYCIDKVLTINSTPFPPPPTSAGHLQLKAFNGQWNEMEFCRWSQFINIVMNSGQPGRIQISFHVERIMAPKLRIIRNTFIAWHTMTREPWNFPLQDFIYCIANGNYCSILMSGICESIHYDPCLIQIQRPHKQLNSRPVYNTEWTDSIAT